MALSDALAEAAMRYHERGWSVFPVEGKKAVVKWKKYQTTRPTIELIQQWAANKSATGIAVALGPVSGDLVVRDFDTPDGWERFANAHPGLAETLPLVRTPRGHHAYFSAPNVPLVKLSDGELRGRGGYVVLPPSHHPEGGEYVWVNKPTATIPTIEPSIFTPDGESEHRSIGVSAHQSDRASCAVIGKGIEHFLDDPRVLDAIKRTLPTTHGTRNKQLFEFARELKAIPELAELPGMALDLIVREWHQLALPNISTKPYGETQIDFLASWESVKIPAGQTPATLWARTEGVSPLPGYETLETLPTRVATLCRLLAKRKGGVFYLSSHQLAKVAGVSQPTAYRCLRALESVQILEITQPGTPGAMGKATRYRYLLD